MNCHSRFRTFAAKIFAFGLAILLVLHTTQRNASANVPPIGGGYWAAEFIIANGIEYLVLAQGGATSTAPAAFNLIPIGPATASAGAQATAAAAAAEAQVAAQGIRIWGMVPKPILIKASIIIGTAIVITLVADAALNGGQPIWRQPYIYSVLMRKSGNWGPNPRYASVSCGAVSQGSYSTMSACRQAFNPTVVYDGWSDITCRDMWNPATTYYNNPTYAAFTNSCNEYVVSCMANSVRACLENGQVDPAALPQGSASVLSSDIGIAWNTSQWTTDSTPPSMANCKDAGVSSQNPMECCTGQYDDYDQVCL